MPTPEWQAEWQLDHTLFGAHPAHGPVVSTSPTEQHERWPCRPAAEEEVDRARSHGDSYSQHRPVARAAVISATPNACCAGSAAFATPRTECAATVLPDGIRTNSGPRPRLLGVCPGPDVVVAIQLEGNPQGVRRAGRQSRIGIRTDPPETPTAQLSADLCGSSTGTLGPNMTMTAVTWPVHAHDYKIRPGCPARH